MGPIRGLAGSGHATLRRMNLLGKPSTATFVFALAAFFGGGCTEAPERIKIDLDSLEVRPFEALGERRACRRIMPEGPVVVELGTVAAGEYIHFGLTVPTDDAEPVRARLVNDDEVIDLGEIHGGEWNDYQNGPMDQTKSWRFEFDMESPLYISHLESRAAGPPSSPHVIVYLVDTLRADHLGCYGYNRDTSPHVDAFAKDAVRFTKALPQSSWTRPSVASLLTSTYPAVHGAVDRSNVLREDLATIADGFRAAGYETSAFMTNPTCLPSWGFGRGFDAFRDVSSFETIAEKDAWAVDHAIERMDHARAVPQFVYVHTMAPHDPYTAPEPYHSRFVQDEYPEDAEARKRLEIVDHYDGEILYNDAQFGRLIAHLKESGLYEDSVIVYLSDHGEEFWEHGVYGHGLNLHEPQMEIPLLIKLPGNGLGGSVREDLVELVDLAPTLLDLIDAPSPEGFQGRRLFPMPESAAGHLGYASLFLEKAHMQMARDETLKYIHDVGGGTETWYDLAADPSEQSPLPGASTEAQALQTHADRMRTAGESGLFLLVTGSLSSGSEVTGTLHGELLDWAVIYTAANSDVEQTEAGAAFRVGLSKGTGAPVQLTEWHEAAEQNNALLRFDVPGDVPVRLELALDGEALTADAFTAANGKTAEVLAGKPILPTTLSARPDAFAPIILPRKTHAYLWYVSPPVEVADSELDPEMLEALDALGYIHD